MSMAHLIWNLLVPNVSQSKVFAHFAAVTDGETLMISKTVNQIFSKYKEQRFILDTVTLNIVSSLIFYSAFWFWTNFLTVVWNPWVLLFTIFTCSY